MSDFNYAGAQMAGQGSLAGGEGCAKVDVSTVGQELDRRIARLRFEYEEAQTLRREFASRGVLDMKMSDFRRLMRY